MPKKRNRASVIGRALKKLSDENYVKPIPGETVEGHSAAIMVELNGQGITDSVTSWSRSPTKVATIVKLMNRYSSISKPYGQDGNFDDFYRNLNSWVQANPHILSALL